MPTGQSGNSVNIKERIESGLLDLGLIFDYVDITKYEYIRIPQNEEWGVMVPEDSPLAKKDYVTPKDIRELPLIISERSLADNDLSDWLGQSYEDTNIIATYNLMYNAAMMVAGGMGAAGCIRLKCSYEGIKFIPAKPEVYNKAVFTWKKTMAQSNTVKAFIDFVKFSLSYT